MIANPAKTSNTLTPQIVISSRLADQMGALGQVYYLVRWFDSIDSKQRKAGAGHCEFTINIAATILGRSPGTIRKNLYECHKRGYFWHLNISHGRVVVYYKSEVNICVQMGIQDLGAIARIDLPELKNLKVQSTRAHAGAMQIKSQAAAKKACKVKSLVDEETLFEGRRSKRSADWRAETGIVHQGRRCTFVDSDFILYGASQASIGRSLGRDERTIRRRLRHSKRTQLAQMTDDGSLDWKVVARYFRDTGDFETANECARRFSYEGTTYRFGCNVYYLDIELIRQRNKRKKLKKAIESSVFSNFNDAIAVEKDLNPSNPQPLNTPIHTGQNSN